MKAIYVTVLASAFGGIFTPARQEPFWENDGDMCHKPNNINPKYTNLEIEFCPRLVDQGLACKVTFDGLGADEFNLSSHHTVYIPQGIIYPSLEDPSLKILETQQANSKFECNRCLLPHGNYKESCIDYRVSYLPELHPEAPCLFQVDCDTNMRAMQVGRSNTARVYGAKYQHNEALIPKGFLFTDVKNYKGRIVTPSNKLEVTHDWCYASDSTAEVNNAASTTATILSSVVTVAATLTLSM